MFLFSILDNDLCNVFLSYFSRGRLFTGDRDEGISAGVPPALASPFRKGGPRGIFQRGRFKSPLPPFKKGGDPPDPSNI